jgi:hypothetical protein
MSSERTISGTPITGGSERPSRSFGKGRVCADPACEIRLSMYNSGKYCYQHEPKVVPRTRGRKVA